MHKTYLFVLTQETWPKSDWCSSSRRFQRPQIIDRAVSMTALAGFYIMGYLLHPAHQQFKSIDFSCLQKTQQQPNTQPA